MGGTPHSHVKLAVKMTVALRPELERELLAPFRSRYTFGRAAGWSSQVARRAHNPEVAGSNPAPATQKSPAQAGFFFGATARRPRSASVSASGPGRAPPPSRIERQA